MQYDLSKFEDNLRTLKSCFKCGAKKAPKLMFCWRCWGMFKLFHGSSIEFVTNSPFDIIHRVVSLIDKK